MKRLTGSMVALITPMSDDGTVDYDALARLVEFHIAAKTTAIVSVGTTGESATLNHEEHIDVIAKTLAIADGRIAIIAGTGSNATAEAIEFSQQANDLGVDAVLLVTPYYNKPTQYGLYQHYKAIASAVDCPQILYNVPGRTAVDLLPETVAKLSQIDNIVGIKDATGDLNVAKQLFQLCVDDFLFYSGDDKTACDFILLGGHGGISVTANVVPAEVQQVYQYALAKKNELAKKSDDAIAVLHTHLFVEANPIMVKYALHKMALCDAGIRLPLTLPAPKNRLLIEKTLTQLGLNSC